MCDNNRRVTAVWCGYCYENLRGKGNHRGHMGYRSGGSAYGPRIMALSKPATVTADNGRLGAPVDSTARAVFPAVYEHCTGETWDDGSPRTTSSLLVFYEAGLWKVCLNDRATERTGWATGVTPEAALESLERMLASDGMDWRKSKAASRKR